jgi:hypothetical protein
MAELKHVGRIISTKQRCLVAYRTLPGESDSCLVIPTDTLNDSYHNSIINLVEGQAGQDANEFAEVLMRSTFSDGQNMLVWLHANGRLLKMGTSQIEMNPTPGATVQLSELNQIIAEQKGVAVGDLALRPQITDNIPAKDVAKVETVSEATPTATVATTPEGQAKEFRSQADKLAKQAAEMRRKAEELVPTKKSK